MTYYAGAARSGAVHLPNQFNQLSMEKVGFVCSLFPSERESFGERKSRCGIPWMDGFSDIPFNRSMPTHE